MSRSGPYRRRCPVELEASIDIALNGRFMVVSSPGPTSFVVKADGSDRRHKVTVGSEQHCSCPAAADELCTHILFVMLRAFKVDPNHEVVWQRFLTEAEVQGLLSGTLSSRGVRRRPEPAPRVGAHNVSRRPLSEDSECPVCYDKMDDCDATTWCRKGCGNSIHVVCMREWAAHNGGGVATCPYCRTHWGPVRAPKKRQDAAPSDGAAAAGALHEECCRQCRGGAGIAGPRFQCLRCVGYNLCAQCASDPLVHPSHPFQVFATPASQGRAVDREGLAARTGAGLLGVGVHGMALNATRALQQQAASSSSSSPSLRLRGGGNPARRPASSEPTQQQGQRRTGSGAHGMQVVGLQPQPPALLCAAELNLLPTTQWVREGDDLGVGAQAAGGGAAGCEVCHERYRYLDVLKQLPCGHVLHSSCAAHHLCSVSPSCPMCHAGCRAPASPAEGAGVAAAAAPATVPLTAPTRRRGSVRALAAVAAAAAAGQGGSGARVVPGGALSVGGLAAATASGAGTAPSARQMGRGTILQRKASLPSRLTHARPPDAPTRRSSAALMS